MVKDKDSDTLTASTNETVNGHSNMEENDEYDELTKKLKVAAETPLSPYSLPKDKALENSGVKNSLNDAEDESISKLTSELGVIENGKFNEKKNESVLDPSKDQEFVFIHDAGFVVKIVAPGVESFDIQVSSTELVQEIHQMLMDREETCHRTCFSLQLDGVTLDNFAELKTIEGLGEGSVIKVVEEPYTVREARIHVRHIRDLLKSLDPADAYNGVECSSFSFLNTITQGDILEKKKSRPDSVDCTPLDYILPSSNDLPLLPLQPQSKDPKIAPALKVLTISGWNPPPGLRKLRGDLLYLYVVTAEDKRLHITASTRGFYINQTTDEEFNPKPATPKLIFHSLADLLGQVSPIFKRNFNLIQKKRTQRHPFERVATPYQVYTWAAPNLEHTVDSIRAEDAFSAKLGYEEHIPGQTRDWNEELQTTRELPRNTLPERLVRERAIFKVHSDFVTAATRGAMAVVDGNVMALNPGEETKMQMFIWNNIFFSLGFDVRDHYKEVGGDAAAFSAPNNDLQGVRAYNAVDVEGLYTLGTVVIDYRGYRVTAQSIIPGILEREQEHSVVYGSVDFGKTVLTHPKYLEMLNKAGQPLKIQPHKVLNEKDEEVELCSSVECKGIIGNDGRHYILDLLRTFPPDVNFLILDSEELSKEAQALGFPRNHRHKLCCLRQELIDAFVDSRYMMFIKLAAFHLQQLGVKNIIDKVLKFFTFVCDKKDEEKTETIEENVTTNGENEKKNEQEPDYQKIVESITKKDKNDVDSTKEVIKKAAIAVGSLKETEFDLRFNPDVFSPGVRHPESQIEKLKKEKQLVKDAADFLLTAQIPGFIRDCLDHSTSPIDGVTLTEALHGRGISMRYLGKITEMVAKIPQLHYLYRIMVLELITRTAKHLFSHYIQSVETMCLSSAISHFLNCFLSSCTNLPSPVSSEELQAMAFQQKAVLMSERVNGVDHAYTISEYTHLALYCFANSQITTALKLLYRARYLTLLVCGENHPEMAVLDSNIGLILHAVGEYDLSLRFLENALKLNINYYGSKSLKVAVSYHLVARTQSCMGEFRGALQNEKETYSIYKQQLVFCQYPMGKKKEWDPLYLCILE
ncbi:Clustered mitochondria protein like protein [Argiope bruennichi]|uniref:Clustered mitochondria protein like protein n=1 Tax=Argiope bruennichi TaxID=94029 RepID=A0A8T0DZZ1_ARGBR|nr:Clustered mitochondria protein like protein [Argiope bruennichi]